MRRGGRCFQTPPLELEHVLGRRAGEGGDLHQSPGQGRDETGTGEEHRQQPAFLRLDVEGHRGEEDQ